jgi:hypothetical protein
MERDSFAGEAGYDPDERAGVVHPAIGLIGALIAAVILGSVGSGSGMLPADPAERIGYFVGGVAVVTLVPWLALFFLSLRHRPPLWWVASFFAILLVAGLTVLARIGMQAQADNEDMIAAAEAFAKVQGADGEAVELGEPKGPLSEIVIDVGKKLIADQQGYAAAMDRAGLKDVANPQVLARDTSGLKDCGRFDRLIPTSKQYFVGIEARAAEIRARIDSSAALAPVKAQFLERFDLGVTRNRPANRKVAELDQSILGELGVVCSVLAKRHWQVRGNTFLFTNDTDLSDYQRHIEQVQSMAREQQDLQRRVLDASRAKLDAIRPRNDVPEHH